LISPKDGNAMEKLPVTLVLGKDAFAQLSRNFEQGRWMSWEFPDYVIRLEPDPTNEDPGVRLRHDGRRLETQRIMDYTFPENYLPTDITQLVCLSYSEAVRCYESACFLGCIALCGRTIETVLGALYEKKVGVHPSKDANKPGLNAILNRLVKEGYVFPAGLKEKMEVIAIHRNMAVHGNLAIPTEDEARSVVYSTRDVLKATAR
jgi:hypothetical protein